MWVQDPDALQPHFVEDLMEYLEPDDESEMAALPRGGVQTDMTELMAFAAMVNQTL